MIRRCILINYSGTLLMLFWLRKRNSDGFHEAYALRIRTTFERLGPTFIKLGQMLSMRPDYIPHVYCKEFEKLLDKAPAVPASVIRRRIEEELKRPISNLFYKFHNTPIASASLSQVHKAVLWDDTVVAVKILRPDVERVIKTDTKLLYVLLLCIGNHIGKIPKRYWLDLIQQLKTWLLEETDYVLERRNMEIMQREMCESQDIRIPYVHDALCCKRIITMDFVDGWSLSDLIRLKDEGLLPAFDFDLQERISYLGDRMFVSSLRNGYVHGDCHPANIFLTADGTFYIVDFGLIQYFDVSIRNDLTLFLIGATFANPELIVKAGNKLGEQPADFNEKNIFMRACEVCDRYRDAPPDVMSNGQFLISLLDVYLEEGSQLPWSVIVYARTTLGFDGIILKLCPEYIFTQHSRGLFVQTYLQNVAEAYCSVPKCIGVLDDILAAADAIPECMQNIAEMWKDTAKRKRWTC